MSNLPARHARKRPAKSMGLFVPGDVSFGFWACQRPLTETWGSGQVLQRIRHFLGSPDVIFGKTDNVEGATTVDINPEYQPDVLADWRNLPFEDGQYEFGYWDPPYFKVKRGVVTLEPCLYKPEGQEIWWTVDRLAILHTHVWPTAWLEGARREAMICITMGPMKRTRMLNVFKRIDSAPTHVNAPDAELVRLEGKERNE